MRSNIGIYSQVHAIPFLAYYHCGLRHQNLLRSKVLVVFILIYFNYEIFNFGENYGIRYMDVFTHSTNC